MGVDTVFVPCSDIDQAINRYTLFGNGVANLHTNFFETHQVTLKMVYCFL